jgi:drug/metabolite transporter (DMT)-like permease
MLPVRHSTRRAAVWAALGIVYVVWGSTYVGVRFAIETLPPLITGGLRFLVAGVLMAALVAFLRGRSALRVTPAQFATAAGSGLLLLLGGNGMVAISVQRVPSGLAALLAACLPLWIVAIRLAVRDRSGVVTVAGLLLGFAGVGLIFLPGGASGADPAYAGLIVLASLSWAVGSLLVAKLPVPADPLVLTAIEMLTGSAAMLAFAGVRGEFTGFAPAAVSVKSWLALGYLIVFGSLVAFTAYLWLLNRAPVSVVSTYAYVNPAVAVLLGSLLAGERLTTATLAGGLVILVAVAGVVTAEGRLAARPATDAEYAAGPNVDRSGRRRTARRRTVPVMSPVASRLWRRRPQPQPSPAA